MMDNALLFGISISLFSMLLILSKRPNQISDKILAAFLFSIAAPMVMFFVRSNPAFANVMQYEPMVLSRLGHFMPLTLGPFMTLYVESLTKSDFRLTKRKMYHFIPFALFLVIATSYPQSPFFSTEAEFPTQDQASPLQVTYATTLLFSLIFYSIWLQVLLKKHRKRVLDYYADNPNHISLMWLTWSVYIMFIFFAVAHIADSLCIINILPSGSFIDRTADTFRHAGFVLFLGVLCFFGIRQSQVFIEPFDGNAEGFDVNSVEPEEETRVETVEVNFVDKAMVKSVDTDDVHYVDMTEMNFFDMTQVNIVEKPDVPPVDKAEVTSVDSVAENPGDKRETKCRSLILLDEQLEEYLEALEDFVRTEKPYRDSELTLGSLATMLDMPKHHLTETLNRKLEKNFYSYINEYRLEELKPLLSDPDNVSQSILTLAYQVGFNSKSTFNSFFKKSTQVTPSQYRKAALTNG